MRIAQHTAVIGVTVATLCLLELTTANAGMVVTWNASSGLPTAIFPPYVLNNTAAASPTLVTGPPDFLQLTTASNSERMTYAHSGAILDTASPFYVEATLRYVSGTSVTARESSAIFLTTEPNRGNTLWIGPDRVFFLSSTGVVEALVTTNDAFHTYRIEYDGADGLQLFIDGNVTPTLTASTFIDGPNFGSIPRIVWGQGSSATFGTTDWASFEHDALVPVPEPSGILLCGLSVCGLAGLVRRRMARGAK